MNVLRSLMMGVLAFLVIGVANAQEKKADKADYAKLIVGVWEATKDQKGLPKGTTIEFSKDGKVKLTVKPKGKELVIDGSYTLKGDKIEMTIKAPSGKDVTETIIINQLDEKEMVSTGEDKEKVTLTRVKK